MGKDIIKAMGNCLEKISDGVRDIFYRPQTPQTETDSVPGEDEPLETSSRVHTPRGSLLSGSISNQLRRASETNLQPLTSTEKKPERPMFKSKTQARLLDCSEISAPNNVSGNMSFDTTQSLSPESSGAYFTAESEPSLPPVKRCKALKLELTNL